MSPDKNTVLESESSAAPASSQALKGGFLSSKERRHIKLIAVIRKTIPLYFLLFPAILYFALFTYIPVFYGFLISFQKYSLMGNTRWVGLAHYIEVFTTHGFWNAFSNTLIIGFGSMLIGIPAAVGTAILLNELLRPFIKRFIQTAIYIPHLFGWVVVAGLWMYIFAPDYGLLNVIRKNMGLEPLLVMILPQYGKDLVIGLVLWKDIGFSSILYLAAITQINPELYESAVLDGAGRLRQIFSITIPSLIPTITILAILGITGIFKLFDPVYVLRNSGNAESINVLMHYPSQITSAT